MHTHGRAVRRVRAPGHARTPPRPAAGERHERIDHPGAHLAACGVPTLPALASPRDTARAAALAPPAGAAADAALIGETIGKGCLVRSVAAAQPPAARSSNRSAPARGTTCVWDFWNGEGGCRDCAPHRCH